MSHQLTKFLTFLSLLTAAALLLVACSPAASSSIPTSSAAIPVTSSTTQPTVAPTSAVAKIDPLVFQQAVRKLWEDHITWTRVYIIAAVAGLPETDAAAQRLLQNQVDIGDAIKPFYGDAAGNQLTSLLKAHILGAVDLLTAAKSGDQAKVDAASKSWYDNANQIAVFLNSANPQDWPLDHMQSMMKSHLDLTLEEATARLKSNWDGDIKAYDKVHNEILGMADMLAEGIVQQFPDRFSPQMASKSQVNLTLAMNKLWEDHVTWTRVYIMSATAGLGDSDAAAQRLLQNQVDIGNAIQPVYGADAAAKLTALLKDHILTAASLLSAAKFGDNAKFQEGNNHWYDNANQIAAFLSSANPQNWPLGDMQSMMKTHLDLTLQEATARLKGDWTGDVAAYDKVHNEILDMAGMLTKGIISQFPDQFK